MSHTAPLLQADWDRQDAVTEDDWPQKGQISIHSYGTRYRPGLDLVLKDLSCDIGPGEKVPKLT